MAEQAVQIIPGAHFYQPDRIGYHENVRDFNTSPDGLDWTDIGRRRVYQQLGRLGLYRDISYDYAPPLRRELARLGEYYGAGDPSTAADIAATVTQMEAFVGDNGIAMTAVHAIQPHLSRVDKQILVQAGINDFRDMAHRNPSTFWLPEGAVDNETLDVLADNGIQAFICAPEQILNDHPRQIRLATGRSIFAVPFDSTISRELAFDKDRRSNAEAFVGRVILPIVNRRRSNNDATPIVLFADGETFGMYDRQKENDPDAPGSDRFLEFAVRKALPNIGVEPVSVNTVVQRMAAEPQRIPEGYVQQDTAWSCANGLTRWNGEQGGEAWKRVFYAAHALLNETVTTIVRRELGIDGQDKDEAFVQQMATGFNQTLTNPGGRHSTPELSLRSAKAASLAARASCGTFFDMPDVSGWQNVVFARAAAEHLTDAGLKAEADHVWDEYLHVMEQMPVKYYHYVSAPLFVLNNLR